MLIRNPQTIEDTITIGKLSEHESVVNADVESCVDVSVDSVSKSVDIEESYLSKIQEYEDKLAGAKSKYSDLEKKLQEIQEDQQSEGYRKGFEQGLMDAENKINEGVESLSSVVESIKNKIDEVLSDAEQFAVDLAFASLIKLLGEKYFQEELVLSIVKSVLKAVDDRNIIKVHVSEQDLSILNKSALFKEINTGRIQIMEDDRVVSGGCIVEAGSQLIDARLDIQLQKLKDILINTANRMV